MTQNTGIQVPDDRVLEFKARLYKVMGDPNRLKALEILRSGESCQCEIVPLLGQSQPTVSRHLKLLEDAGLITSRKDGTRMFYRVVDGHIFNLLDSIDDNMIELVSQEIAKKYRF
jgi:ArsR family transcriptional regulator